MSTDREALLWAYAASEAQSVADALGAIARLDSKHRRAAMEAQESAAAWSFRWCQLVTPITADPIIYDARDRMQALREWLTKHVVELDRLTAELRR